MPTAGRHWGLRFGVIFKILCVLPCLPEPLNSSYSSPHPSFPAPICPPPSSLYSSVIQPHNFRYYLWSQFQASSYPSPLVLRFKCLMKVSQTLWSHAEFLLLHKPAPPSFLLMVIGVFIESGSKLEQHLGWLTPSSWLPNPNLQILLISHFSYASHFCSHYPNVVTH